MLRKINFTDRGLKALAKPEKEVTYSDTTVPGLKLRHLPSGTKSWSFVYQVDGKKKRIGLGRCPAVSLADARQMARELQLDRAKGNDPHAERRAAREEEARQKTVGWLIDEYLERWAKLRKKSWTEDERILNKRVRPRWG